MMIIRRCTSYCRSPRPVFSFHSFSSSPFHGVNPKWNNKISVFWDLDNKPPESVPPYDAAVRLREVAQSFGHLVDMVAYANRYAFSYLPPWVREERQRRRELDHLEVRGLVLPDQPYICGYCGCKCRTNVALRKHFKQLHERERNKRLARMDSLNGKRKVKFKQSLAEKEFRYKEAARDIIKPKVGYGLMQELKRAGVVVSMVSDKPQAADEALKARIGKSVGLGIQCICLVSDDSDFISVLQDAKQREIHTVVVGNTASLKRYADVWFSWSELSTGRAFDRATELASQWYGNAGRSAHSELESQRYGKSAHEHQYNVVRPSTHGNQNESQRFPVRTLDFKEWDLSDDAGSDMEGVITKEGYVTDADIHDVDITNDSETDLNLWLNDSDEEDDL